jgi:hypothetical protein
VAGFGISGGEPLGFCTEEYVSYFNKHKIVRF